MARAPSLFASLLVASCLTVGAATFVVPRVAMARTRAPSTVLNIEDHIADMIDKELYRQSHMDEFEKEWNDKTHAIVEQTLKQEINLEGEAFLTEDTPRQKAKDKRLAENDPQRYCADRCVATGNCDVYEDIYKMSAQQVIEFCEECVLSDEEEPCDVPEAMFEGSEDVNGKLKP